MICFLFKFIPFLEGYIPGKKKFIFPFSQGALRSSRLALISAKNAGEAKNFSKEKLKIH